MPLFNNPIVATGRTKFFQKRKIEGVQEILNQLAGGIQSVQTAATTAKATVDDINNSAEQANAKVDNIITQSSTVLTNLTTANNAVDSISTSAASVNLSLGEIATNSALALTDIQSFNNAVGKPEDTDGDSLFFKIKMLKDIASPSLPFPENFPEEMVQKLWVCERTLHRVEQLITDKAPGKNPGDNNSQLDKMRDDKLFNECISNLGNPKLKESIKTIHSHFNTGSPKERYERFSEIQELRREIVDYLAAKTEEEQGVQVS